MTIIDVHAHLDDGLLSPTAMLRKMDAQGVDKVVMIPRMNDPLPHTPKSLLTLFRGLMNSPLHPLARALNSRFYTKDGNLKLSGKIVKIFSEPDNQTVTDLIAAHPDRFLGWIFLNPRIHDPVEELEKWRASPGYVGVKLHPHWHQYSIVDLLPLAKRCEELGLPLLIHLGFGRGGHWRVLADACPKLTVVFAHAGFPAYKRMWKHLRHYPNLWVDISSPYLSSRLVRDAVNAIGPHKVLYGTDAPYGFHEADDSYDYSEILGWVHDLPVGAHQIDNILGNNVRALLDGHASSRPHFA